MKEYEESTRAQVKGTIREFAWCDGKKLGNTCQDVWQLGSSPGPPDSEAVLLLIYGRSVLSETSPARLPVVSVGQILKCISQNGRQNSAFWLSIYAQLLI